MKKFFTLLVLAACCAAMTWGCSDDKYDDTEIRQEIENLKQEIASMKEQVNSLKTIIDALNENKFITNYTEAADGSCTITFNDGKTITLHNGKDGAAAPAIGIAQFEGIYYWTLGGDDQWLLDDNQNKIPVAGQNGKTPTINKDGYWEIDGETIKGEDGQPIKAVGKDGANGDKGEDGDSFFKSVVQDDESVTFTLTNGDQIVLPKAKEVNFVIERTSLTLKFGASQNLAVTQKGVENLAIANPNDETPIDNRTVPHNAHRACTGGENQKKRVVERQSFVCRSHPRSQCHGTAADEGDRHPENPARHYDIA